MRLPGMNRNVGLGDEFRIEVNAVLQEILKSPEKFRLAAPSVHKVSLKLFCKYGVYYSIESDAVNVVAVFHSSRNPAQLHPRLK